MTRKKITGLTLATVVFAGLTGASAGALGDPPSLQDSGRFYLLQAEVSPPKASTERQRQTAGVEITFFTGNIRTGEPSRAWEGLSKLEIRTPAGFSFNHEAFPSCPPLGRTERDCPRGARIGSGSAIADPRPFLADFIHARRVDVYNGKLSNGRPALVLFAELGGTGFSILVPLAIKPARENVGPAFIFDQGPEPVPEGAFTAALVSVTVTFPKRARRFRGRSVNLWETPTTCRGSWLFRATATTFGRQRFQLNQHAPCVRAGS